MEAEECDVVLGGSNQLQQSYQGREGSGPELDNDDDGGGEEVRLSSPFIKATPFSASQSPVTKRLRHSSEV